MKFSDNYITAQKTNSSGNPMSPKYLQDRAKELEYIREYNQLIDEYATKPKDETYAKRIRELFMKYHPDTPVMKEYHNRRQQEEQLKGGVADGVPDLAFDSEVLAGGTKEEYQEHMSEMGNEGIEQATEIAKDHLINDPEYYSKEKD